jgi:hypothetical protein
MTNFGAIVMFFGFTAMLSLNVTIRTSADRQWLHGRKPPIQLLSNGLGLYLLAGNPLDRPSGEACGRPLKSMAKFGRRLSQCAVYLLGQIMPAVLLFDNCRGVPDDTSVLGMAVEMEPVEDSYLDVHTPRIMVIALGELVEPDGQQIQRLYRQIA